MGSLQVLCLSLQIAVLPRPLNGSVQAPTTVCLPAPTHAASLQRDANIVYVARDKVKGVPHHAKAGNINSCLLKEGPGKVGGGERNVASMCLCKVEGGERGVADVCRTAHKPGVASRRWALCLRSMSEHAGHVCKSASDWHPACSALQGEYVLILDADMSELGWALLCGASRAVQPSTMAALAGAPRAALLRLTPHASLSCPSWCASPLLARSRAPRLFGPNHRPLLPEGERQQQQQQQRRAGGPYSCPQRQPSGGH